MSWKKILKNISFETKDPLLDAASVFMLEMQKVAPNERIIEMAIVYPASVFKGEVSYDEFEGFLEKLSEANKEELEGTVEYYQIEPAKKALKVLRDSNPSKNREDLR